MNKKHNIDYSKNIQYIEHYIKELESRHGDIDQINELKRLKKLYSEQNITNQKSNFKEGLKVKTTNNRKEKIYKTNNVKKKKIKRPSLKKQIAIGLLVGTLIGIPTATLSYNYVINSPSAHNYRTIREKRKNLQHDDTNYRKHLKRIGLTEEEIEKRIDEEQRMNRWNTQEDR